MSFSMKFSTIFLVLLNLFLMYVLMSFLLKGISSLWLEALVYFAFPTSKSFSILLLSLFLSLSMLNLLSMVIYSYPVTTTLAFNLGAAFSCWVSGVLLQLMKLGVSSSVLPSNSPWYLVPFLCVVELVSVLVRPITLCFRLLANMTAGHVLIALICKMPFVWTIGSLFGGLELMVAIVQGFVFAMLISVYFEEALSH